jgi:anti-sigma factor RsiW
MNGHDGTHEMREACGEILDLLSVDFSRSLSLAERERTERHVAECSACAEDFRFMAMVYGTRPQPPRSFAMEALAQYEAELSRRTSGWWSGSMAAAAVLLLAMGIGLASQASDPSGDFAGWTVAVESEEGMEDWAGDDWFIAGAPYLEGVSDETLLVLLTEGYFE